MGEGVNNTIVGSGGGEVLCRQGQAHVRPPAFAAAAAKGRSQHWDGGSLWRWWTCHGRGVQWGDKQNEGQRQQRWQVRRWGGQQDQPDVPHRPDVPGREDAAIVWPGRDCRNNSDNVNVSVPPHFSTPSIVDAGGDGAAVPDA
jgi:hypothetical protein